MKAEPTFFSDFDTSDDYIILRNYVDDKNTLIKIIFRNAKHENIGAIELDKDSLSDLINELRKINKTLTA